MDADPTRIHHALVKRWPMRVGRKLGRTLYLEDPAGNEHMADLCVGIVDSADLALLICYQWNQARDAHAGPRGDRQEQMVLPWGHDDHPRD